MPLGAIPVGTIVHNVEMKVGAGGKIARAAGNYAQLVGKDAGYAQIKLMSGELRLVRAECLATVGAVSNPGQHEPVARQGGSQPLARAAAAQPRRRDEPGRPPARRQARAAPRADAIR